MFPRSGVQFLRELAEHNDKAFFAANKARYEADVKAPMIAIVEALDERLAQFAPEYAVPASKAIPRIHRDTRFSADKSPYKTEVSAIFPCEGKEKSEAAGFFFRITGSGADLLGGVYMPAPEGLAKIRQAISAEPSAFEKLVATNELVELLGGLQGEKLARMPKGYASDHPAGEYLKHKQLYFGASLPLAVVTSENLVSEVAERFRVMTPFVRWLDSALGNEPAA